VKEIVEGLLRALVAPGVLSGEGRKRSTTASRST